MKTFILLILIITTNAKATSYWYDYCDATIPAYKAMKLYHPEVDIAPEARCNDFYLSDEIPACFQSLKSTSLLKYKAKFIVKIKTENAGVLKYMVKFRAENGGNCKVVKVKEI